MADESAYIDTSILGAYYCPEPLGAAAGRIGNLHEPGSVTRATLC